MAGLHQNITQSVICSQQSSNMANKRDHHRFPANDGGPNRDHPNSSDVFSGKFPKGLRVLVFDEDPAYQLILEKHLQEFQYEVTGCNEEERAIYLLRNHTIRYDIAIIEAENSNSDRFRLISEIGSETDLPIIIISKDDSVESIINWMRNGACDYLIKPIRAEDLRLIFKHVVKKIQGRSPVTGDAEEKPAGAVEKSSSVGDSTIRNPNKRKRCNSEENHDRHLASTSKKRRVVWDEELNKKFLDAVEFLGKEKAVPKKILERMGVDYLTRENVASHLQKFRMNLKKQNAHNDKNQSLITPQQGKIYGVEDATKFYMGGNVEISSHHINNIPQPCVQQLSTNPNLTTQLVSPLGHHQHLVDGVSVAVSNRNLVMTHNHHHQTSDFASIENTEESLGYNNFEVHNEDETEVRNLTCWFTQDSQEAGLYHYQDPMTTIIPNDHHLSNSLEMNPQQMMNVHEAETSMLHVPSFPSSYAHSSFLDQQESLTMADESGGFNYSSGYSMNNNRLT